jgi:hypothetical protein
LVIFAVAGLLLTLGAWLGGAFRSAPEESPARLAAPAARGPSPEALRTEAPRLAEADSTTPQRGPATAGVARPDVAALTPGRQTTAALPEASVPRSGSAALSAAASSAPPQVTATPRPEPARPVQNPPRFDVARVGARGALVTAGRAAPGAEVVLLENGREIGRGRADARGEWVILPDAPLTPGARELTLTARLPGGEPLAGESSVVLLVPGPPSPVLADARPQPAPGVPTTEARPVEPPPAALALLLPAPGVQAPIRVLQAPAAARLSIDLVDYAGNSGMRFAGAAPAGAQLRFYIDEALSGEVVADAQGRWSHSPQAQPAFGRHVLRADQLGAQGQVISRVEQPFQRDAPPAVASAEETPSRHVVQPGHNLWRIARGTYGQGLRYTDIFAANREQIRNPNLIYPGQVFTLPRGAP